MFFSKIPSSIAHLSNPLQLLLGLIANLLSGLVGAVLALGVSLLGIIAADLGGLASRSGAELGLGEEPVEGAGDSLPNRRARGVSSVAEILGVASGGGLELVGGAALVGGQAVRVEVGLELGVGPRVKGGVLDGVGRGGQVRCYAGVGAAARLGG